MPRSRAVLVSLALFTLLLPIHYSHAQVCSGYNCTQGQPVCDNTCSPPVGSPNYACSDGQAFFANGSWTCGCSGATKCYFPPPTNWGCNLRCGPNGWQCAQPCPIIIDTKDEGFHLTSKEQGVRFAFSRVGDPTQVSWTDPAYSNGFLVLDRNQNGEIDDATELFGNATPQPACEEPNGFLALAVFDRPDHGGNNNGVIDTGDSIYPKLRVWIDSNHNGRSEPSELHALSTVGILRIGLRYHESHYVDQYGNEFRYRARIWDAESHDVDRTYDVFLKF